MKILLAAVLSNGSAAVLTIVPVIEVLLRNANHVT
jgi:hypothetical protein